MIHQGNLSFLLEFDKDVSLLSVTQNKLPEEMSLILHNRKYLEQSGEGYPGINTVQQYESYLLAQYGDHETISLKRFTVMYKGQNVGQIGLHSFMIRNFQPTAEIFYWIDERYQGKGIISRACQRIQFYAYQTLGLEVLYIHCLISNSKSENVAKRCGFSYQGIAKFFDSEKGNHQEYKRFAKTVEQFEQDLINEQQ